MQSHGIAKALLFVCPTIHLSGKRMQCDKTKKRMPTFLYGIKSHSS